MQMSNLSPSIAEAHGRAPRRGHFKYQMKVQTRDARQFIFVHTVRLR